jgi:hypothetical protein
VVVAGYSVEGEDDCNASFVAGRGAPVGATVGASVVLLTLVLEIDKVSVVSKEAIMGAIVGAPVVSLVVDTLDTLDVDTTTPFPSALIEVE